MTFSEAIRQTLHELLRTGKRGSCWEKTSVVTTVSSNVRAGLLKEFGKERVVDTLIVEQTLVRAGVGMALSGLRPIVEIRLCGPSDVACNVLLQIDGKVGCKSQSIAGNILQDCIERSA